MVPEKSVDSVGTAEFFSRKTFIIDFRLPVLSVYTMEKGSTVCPGLVLPSDTVRRSNGL